MEVAMVFILTQFFGTIGVFFRKPMYCVPTANNELWLFIFRNDVMNLTDVMPRTRSYQTVTAKRHLQYGTNDELIKLHDESNSTQ